MRIVSLLPSATEIVFALGLGDELVGRTHECDYPSEAESVPVMTRSVGGGPDDDSRQIHERVTNNAPNPAASDSRQTRGRQSARVGRTNASHPA